MKRLATALWSIVFTLGGCQPAAPPLPTPADLQRAETLRPTDAVLAERYERSCRVCHSVPGGAPLTGHGPAWQPRLQQGNAVLLAHAREGFNAMPPRGLCSDCSDADLRRLIECMSQPR